MYTLIRLSNRFSLKSTPLYKSYTCAVCRTAIKHLEKLAKCQCTFHLTTTSSFISGLSYVSRQCPRVWEWGHITPSLIPRFSLKSWERDCTTSSISFLVWEWNHTILQCVFFSLFPQTVQPSAIPSASTPSLITVAFLQSLPLM